MQGTKNQIITWLLTQEDKQYEIKEYSEKRSLSQNNYLWEIINKIGNITRKSKEEIYFDLLKHYGQSTIISVLSNIELNGFIKYYEVIGTANISGKEFNHIKVYKGSSEYDSKEMAILIDGLIQEASNLGISTMTPNEIARLRL